jgi:hypothetical protein
VQVGMCTRGRCDQQGCNAEWRRVFFFTEFAEKMTQKKNRRCSNCSNAVREFLFEKKHKRAVPRQRHGVGFFVSQFHREQITIDSSRVSGNISRGDKGIAGMEANGKKK